jgi:hypothetical protein
VSANEEHIDKLLGELVERFQKEDEIRRAYRNSVILRSFHTYEKGDRVSMVLTGIAIDGIHLEETREVEGVLINPRVATVEIKIADGLEEWQGKTIGLAVRTPSSFKKNICKYVIAGNQEVAYFHAEDLVEGQGSDIYLPEVENDTNIYHLPLKYGRVAVGGCVIFDFLEKDKYGRNR